MMETFSILLFAAMASLLMTHRPAVSMRPGSMRPGSARPRASGASDAAAGLGNAGDLRGGLGRPLGEELVQVLDAHPGGLAQGTHARAGALFRVLVPHKPDDLPVLQRERADAALQGDLRRHLLAPLLWVGKETVVADGDLGASVDLGGHDNLRTYSSFLDPASRGAAAGRRLPARGMPAARPGTSRPGSSMCQ